MLAGRIKNAWSVLHRGCKPRRAEGVKGSHYIFFKEDLNEIINIQEIDGQAKAYQVKQIREVIINNKLEIQEDDES